jgi:alkylation response protein AidB-like acyl-CoA dehydrogenase
MVDYFLSDEEKRLKQIAREIAEKEVLPARERLDRESEFPHEIMKKIGEAGLPQVYVPKEYGGSEGSIFGLCLITEELSRIDGGVAVSYAASALGSLPIMIGGSDAQKAKYLPDIASGEKYCAFGLTESDAGSDAGRMKTFAVKKGDEYILNGSKIFCTNGQVADTYTIFAKTDPEKGSRGISAFIVEKGWDGFSFGKIEDKLGIRSSIQAELLFEDCRVPADNLIGREGQGFIVAMKTLDKSRPGIGAQAIGIAQGAFELATKYAQEREQFGGPLSSLQGIQFMLADRGLRHFTKESAMCKLFSSDVAMKVTVDAVQIFGGYGYMRDYPVEKYMRDAKITQIYEGTNQVQRLVIAGNLIREMASK